MTLRTHICLLLWLLLVGMMPLQAQSASDCVVDARLTVGERGRVLAGHNVNIRPEPTTAIARLDLLPAGTTFDVVDGPLCAEGYHWWQIDTGTVSGWSAEGSPDGTYWLEPRGQRVMQEAPWGELEPYVILADGTTEPEGCLRPPDDYTIVQIGYARLNRRTLAMLDQAQQIYDATGRTAVNFRQLITQGSYNPGGVEASFGTHDGGGAVDISVRSYLDWSVMRDEIEPMIRALRIAGFAAWLRDTGDLYPDSPIHIHAIAVGDVELSDIAAQQIDSEFGYLRGYDGLPREDGAYVEDRHGGPVLCGWMYELDYDNLPTPDDEAS